MKKFKNDLLSLPTWKQAAFALLCCERMLPNYLIFAKDSGWGDADTLRKALDIVWTALEEDRKAGEFREIISACEEAIPDTERFTSDYTSAALDAAASIALLIDLLQSF